MTNRKILSFIRESALDIANEYITGNVRHLEDAIYNEVDYKDLAEKTRRAFQRIKFAAICGEKYCDELLKENKNGTRYNIR